MTELALPELEKRVKALLQKTLDRREPVLTRLPGILGLTNTNGSAEVSGKPGWVYVRIGNDETVATCFNNRTSKKNGLPVIVGYDPAQPNLFQVLSTREVYEGAGSDGAAIPNHHAQHEFGTDGGGQDLVWVRMRQLTDLLCYPTDPESLIVNIATGQYLIGTTVYKYEGGTLDLTSYVPASSRKWVLVAFDESGPYVVEGTTGLYGYSDIPDASDPTHYKVCAILLKVGDTEITDWPNDVRFVDLRLAGSRSMSGSGGYIDFGNAIVVAESGGNYDVIQDGIDAATTSTHIIVLNGSWTENITYSGAYITMSTLKDAHNSGPFGTYVVGADDTGPIATISGGIISGFVFNRVLTSGAGEYIGVDASAGTYNVQISDLRIHIGGGASGRDVVALKFASLTDGNIDRCVILAGDAGSGGAALEVVGSHPVKAKNCFVSDTDNATAIRIENTDVTEFWHCEINGDVTVNAAGTVRFINCRIGNGDLTLAGSGCTVYLEDTYIDGNITVGASDTLSGDFRQKVGGTISNSGTILADRLVVETATTETVHYMGPRGASEASIVRATPATVSGANRSAFEAFFTDYLDDTTNWEKLQLVTFDDGADVFACLRTLAAGTGTVRDLRIGAGSSKSTYVTITSAGNVSITGTLTVDTINEYTADAGVTVEGVLLKDNDIDTVGALTIDTIDEHTADAGVTVEGVLIKDGEIPDYTPRDEWLQNGIVVRTDCELDWDDATRTLTIEKTGGSFDYFIAGVRYSESGQLSEVITDTEGMWLFYLDSEGSITSVNAPSEAQIEAAVEDYCILAYVYWDATNNDGRLMDERHGYRMSPATHHYLHDNVGSVYNSGMALADFVIDDTGADDEDAQFSVSAGTFYDEDVKHSLSAVLSTTGLEIWYLDTTNWRWTTNAGFSVLTAGSGRLAFNDSGAQTEVSNAGFVLCHVVATNVTDDSGANPKYIAIQGQAEYGTLTAARAGAETEINALVFGTFPVEEVVPIGTVIFQTSTAYSNSVKARTRTTDSGDNFVDWRTASLKGSGGSVSDHGGLAGLSDDDHIQYILATGARAGATAQAQDFGATYGIKSDLISESTVDTGVTVDGVLIKDNYVITDGGLEIGATAAGKGSDGQGYFEDNTAAGAVLIGWAAQANGVSILSHISAANHSRGFAIKTTDGLETWVQFGAYATGQTFQYGYIGSAYDEAHMRFYKFDATTPSYITANHVNFGVVNTGDAPIHPLYIRATSGYTGTERAAMFSQDYASNDSQVDGVFIDMQAPNPLYLGYGQYIRFGSSSSYAGGTGLILSHEGTIGASDAIGIYAVAQASLTTSSSFFGFKVGAGAASVTGNVYAFYAGLSGVSPSGSRYGVFISGEDANWFSGGLEVGTTSVTKSGSGQIFVEESASTGAVIITFDSPAYGITIRNHIPVAGWARGFRIANTGATEVYSEFSVMGSGQTFTYAYIGSAFDQTSMRFYKATATTPSYTVVTNANFGVVPAGETATYPVWVKTSGGYANTNVGVYVYQNYSANATTEYCYFGDLVTSNTGYGYRALYLRQASGTTFAGYGYGFYFAMDGTISGATNNSYGCYVIYSATASVGNDTFGFAFSTNPSATLSGDSFAFYASNQANPTGNSYGFYSTGEDYNYVSGYFGIGNTDWNAKLGIGTGGASWTTSSWGRAIQIQAGTVMKWKLSGTYAYGMGVTGSPSVHYFFSSTADDNSVAPSYWMSYSASAGQVTISALVRGGGTSGHFQVETDYGTSQYGMLNSSYCHLYTDASVGFYFQKSITVNGFIYAYGTTKTNDIGTSALAWDDVWADDFQNVADFFWADEHRGQPVDDLAAIRQIKPSQKRDERTGMLLIDDDTLPAFMLTRAKDTGEVVYDPEGKPYLSLKMVTSVIMGAVRQLASDQENLWAAINELKGG